jgi:hypothetical protein
MSFQSRAKFGGSILENSNPYLSINQKQVLFEEGLIILQYNALRIQQLLRALCHMHELFHLPKYLVRLLKFQVVSWPVLPGVQYLLKVGVAPTE